LTIDEKKSVQDLLRGAVIVGAFEAIPFQGIYAGSILSQYALIFLVGFAAYAINKKEIFEIKVILVELLLGLIGAMLIALPFFTDNLLMKVSLYILFILFCIFLTLL